MKWRMTWSKGIQDYWPVDIFWCHGYFGVDVFNRLGVYWS